MEQKIQKENPHHKSNDSKRKPARETADRMRAYARYSGMAVQLGVTITIGAYAGRWVDQRFEMDRPIFTAVFALLATVVAVYALIRGIVRIK